MLERFSSTAREAVQQARIQARSLHQGYIGTEHLLLALTAGQSGIAARVLEAHGVTQQSLRGAIVAASDDGLDPEALATVGIDLDAVRAAAEASFGPGVLDVPAGSASEPGRTPFTRPAKKSLELALREAVHQQHREIDSGHLLLGIIRADEGLGTRILKDLGQDLDALRAEVLALPRGEAV